MSDLNPEKLEKMLRAIITEWEGRREVLNTSLFSRDMFFEVETRDLLSALTKENAHGK